MASQKFCIFVGNCYNYTVSGVYTEKFVSGKSISQGRPGFLGIRYSGAF